MTVAVVPGVTAGAADRSDAAVEVLREGYLRVLDALVDGSVRAGDLASWPTWELGPDAQPERVVAGRPTMYDGDAGIALAVAELAATTRRDDARGLAVAGIRNARRRIGDDPGLLSGRAGVALAERRIAMLAGRPATLSGDDLGGGLNPWAGDLTSGAAGALLALTDVDAARSAVELIGRLRQPEPIGSSWPDLLEAEVDDRRPLCGLAHGASGIAWALAETAYRHPELADEALTLADEALAWESAWFDPVRGGWPDLRPSDAADDREPGYPDLWCHGSAGIGMVRLRLLQLARRGLVTPWPVETIQAEAEAAVSACGRGLARSVARVQAGGWSQTPAGMTLCHGLAGPLEVLLTAYQTWHARSHLDAARELAAALVAELPDDPWQWPSGLPARRTGSADGVAGLFLGMAGTAVTLARLVHPDTGPASPALLALG